MLGPKILEVADSGAGKTYTLVLSAMQQVLAGSEDVKLFIIFTEPGMATLSAMPKEIQALYGKKIFWNYVSVTSSLDAITSMAAKVNSINYEGLSQMPETGKKEAKDLLAIYALLKNFKDMNTGQEFGNVETWPANWILGIDSFTGLADAAWANHRGDNLTAGMQNYQVVQNTLKAFLKWLCRGLKCTVIMTAHTQRETNEVTGQSLIYPAAPGAKLSPLVGRDFDEVFMCVKDGKDYYWSTAVRGFASKNRNLPTAEKIPINWGLIFDKFNSLYKESPGG